jgi:hypothetical protein
MPSLAGKVNAGWYSFHSSSTTGNGNDPNTEGQEVEMTEESHRGGREDEE